MEHHFVHKVSRLFPSSFTSCQFRIVPDVVESSIPITKILNDDDDNNNNGGPDEPFSNMYRNPFLSNLQGQEQPNMLTNEKKVLKNLKKKPLFLGYDNEGRKCPPVIPFSVLASERRMKPKESTKINNSCSSNSGWFSSSDDEEKDVVRGQSDAFFSLSSSCSSESFRLRTANASLRYDNKSTEIGRCSSGISTKSANTIFSHCSNGITKTSTKNPPGKHRNLARNHTQESKILKGCKVVESSTELYYGNCRNTTSHCRKTTKARQNTGKKNRRNKNTLKDSTKFCGSATICDRLEESYAVEKSSDDPYGDFRTSMVEMIIEKQIFGAEDLEKLLYCFLSLNLPCYHRIIVEVFTEICDTLYSN